MESSSRSSAAQVAWVTVACLVVGFLIVGGAADAASKKERSRTQVEPYDRPSTAIALNVLYVGNCNPLGIGQGCVDFDLKPSDRYISLKVEDATGQPIYATVWDSNDMSIAEFCGETEKPIPNPGSEFIYVELPIHGGVNCSPSTVTRGTVTATFTPARK